MPRKPQPDRRLTNVLILLGTAAVAFLPLYLTRFHAAIEDGGLLLIGSVFAADGIMRCLNPANKATNWSVFFGVGSLVFLGLTISEYAPLAARQLEQDNAVAAWVHEGDQTRLDHIRSNALLLQKTKGAASDTVPNDSLLLLGFSVVLDAAVILVVEEK